MCLQAIAFNELQESQHEALLQSSIDLARKLAGDFKKVSLTELAIEISVCLNLLLLDRNLTDRPDGQLVTANGASCQRFRSCPDESVLLILDIEDNRERPA